MTGPSRSRPGGRRIGIDARFYGLGSAGLARLTRGFVSGLAGLQTPHTFVVFLRKDDLSEFTLKRPNVEVRTTTIRHYTVREQLLFARELRRAKLDLMHFTNFNFPLTYRQPFIISINDLTLFEFAGRSRTSRLKVRPMRWVMRAGVKHSRRVLTLSRYQRELIVKHLAAEPSKVTPIHLAVDKEFRVLPTAGINRFRRQHDLTGPFIMYTGQWRQHKNLVRLIKAFRLVRDQLEAKLVLVGKVDPAFPVITETISAQKLQRDVVLTDFVDDAELPLFYNAADVFAFPSLSEGFGLPPLEAMACGTTVAASSAPPMPEILGGAAAYFDPQSTEAMAETLLRLLRNSRERDRLRQLGLRHVKRYSWRQTAQETLAVYNDVLRSL